MRRLRKGLDRGWRDKPASYSNPTRAKWGVSSQAPKPLRDMVRMKVDAGTRYFGPDPCPTSSLDPDAAFCLKLR